MSSTAVKRLNALASALAILVLAFAPGLLKASPPPAKTLPSFLIAQATAAETAKLPADVEALSLPVGGVSSSAGTPASGGQTASPAAASQQFSYRGCYNEPAYGENSASANYNSYPQEQRARACLNFCETGNASDAQRVARGNEPFPRQYAGFRNNDSWCFCSNTVTGTLTSRTPQLCSGGTLTMLYTRSSDSLATPSPQTVTPPPQVVTPPAPVTPSAGLGSVWHETELGWRGVWTRRGNSNTFDAVWTLNDLCETAVLTIQRQGSTVSIHRRQPDGRTCQYQGLLAADGRSISGTYFCEWARGPFQWHAQIDSALAALAPAPQTIGPSPVGQPAPAATVSGPPNYQGCYDVHESAFGKGRAAASFYFYEPRKKRAYECVNFCATGNAPGAQRVGLGQGPFPRQYTAFRNNDAWCFCGNELRGTPTGRTPEQCVGGTLTAVYAADAGDQAGWSVLTDPRGRAFLLWVPEQGGPRTLMLGCLRDAGTFTTMSYAVGASDEINAVKLTLSNGQARFDVEGSITLYPAIGKSSFISDLDVDAEQLQALGRRLLPVLEGPGDIEISMAPGGPAGELRTMQIPISGLASVLGSFRNVCFR